MAWNNPYPYGPGPNPIQIPNSMGLIGGNVRVDNLRQLLLDGANMANNGWQHNHSDIRNFDRASLLSRGTVIESPRDEVDEGEAANMFKAVKQKGV